jgi:hypothetical protein
MAPDCPVHRWSAHHLAALWQKLRRNKSQPFARAKRILFYLGTHGITLLLLTALLLGVVLLE